MHYHVQNHHEDDNIFVSNNLAAALEYAATEMGHAVDNAYEMVSLHGEAKRFEDAYNSFTNYESWDALALNLLNLVRQTDANPSKRAPHYRDEPKCGPRWTVAAHHLMEEVNNLGPDGFRIFSCDKTDCYVHGD